MLPITRIADARSVASRATLIVPLA